MRRMVQAFPGLALRAHFFYEQAEVLGLFIRQRIFDAKIEIIAVDFNSKILKRSTADMQRVFSDIVTFYDKPFNWDIYIRAVTLGVKALYSDSHA